MSAAPLHLAGPVLVGPDDVRDELWVVDGRVTFTEPSGDCETIRGWVLPGLVDAHCHVGLDAHGPVDAETAEAQIRGDRAAGTLLIRDAGSPSDTRWIDDREDLPVVIRAGRHIARTRRYIRDYADEIEPDQLVETVRAQARRGDGWVKLVGDWIDRATGDLAPCWPQDVAREAITVAHEEGARVTAHCFGEEVLPQLAAAGIDCIEHATGLRGEVVDTFARQGIAIVPTLVNIATFPQIAEPARAKFPDYHRHMLDLHRRRHETVRTAFEAGVPIYCGTDAGGSLPHGLVGSEARELRAAGLPPRAVLDAVSWGARHWLGRPGIEEGAQADLCVYATDPREDLDVLAFPTAVVLRGVVRG
ncbi:MULTISPECIES: amidohydrolase family protein [Arsenicicoccus]|uniref:amidohydrolase family protein n=1 Tax=Arsenicicoccus TaxID=267408 RepID=UPI00257A6105|nr:MULTISPECIES: amidohydrolase family protein [Arsenicicoccus]